MRLADRFRGRNMFHYPKSADRVQRMLARLYADGFAAFG